MRIVVQRRFLVVGGAALAVAMAGCGTGASTTAQLGAQGGVVSLESGLTLEVPQGALSDRIQVTLRETRLDSYSDIQIDPSGLQLTTPVSLGWADDGDDALESDQNEQFSIERDGGRARAHLHHFGHFRHWRHCGSDGGMDGGCPGHSHDDDGGIEGHGKSCDGGRCDDGNEGHGQPGGGGCSGGHDGGKPSPVDDGGCQGGDGHHGGHCPGGHPDAGVDAGVPVVP